MEKFKLCMIGNSFALGFIIASMINLGLHGGLNFFNTSVEIILSLLNLYYIIYFYKKL